MQQFNTKSSILSILIASLVVALVGPVTALAASPAAVNLGTAGNYVILAKTGVSTTGSTQVVGNIGVSPAAATYITGFALSLPAAAAFSTSALVTGNVYATGYADPTPANLTTAVLDMQNAYTDAAGRAADVTELGAGNIGGLTLAPGVYKWSTGVTIPTNVTLSGSASDVWILQIAQNLNVSSGVHITLTGGAQAGNVFWVVGGQTTIGTTAAFNGNILDQTAIVLNTGATLSGHALAQTAVTLDSNAVTIANPSAAAVTSVVITTPVVIPPAPSTSSNPVLVQTQTTTTSSASYDAQVATLQAQVTQLSGVLQSMQLQAGQHASTSASGHAAVTTIAGNLMQGGSGANVDILQQFLIAQNKGTAAQALANAGATAYFGSLTRAALAEFQTSVGITPALGNFGAITRAYLSTHY
jgi:hypothetical protein